MGISWRKGGCLGEYIKFWKRNILIGQICNESFVFIWWYCIPPFNQIPFMICSYFEEKSESHAHTQTIHSKCWWLLSIGWAQRTSHQLPPRLQQRGRILRAKTHLNPTLHTSHPTHPQPLLSVPTQEPPPPPSIQNRPARQDTGHRPLAAWISHHPHTPRQQNYPRFHHPRRFRHPRRTIRGRRGKKECQTPIRQRISGLLLRQEKK